MKTEHILIMRFSAMGDVAMTVPVVRSLAQQYPQLRITVLSKPFARPFFEGLAPNVGFMGADLKGEYHGLKGLNALYRRLVAKNFTAIADFHSILRSGYLRMRFNIGRYRVEHIDKHRAERRQLVAQGAAGGIVLPSSFDSYADVLARLGYPVRLEFKSIFPPEGGNLRLLPQQIGLRKVLEQWIGIAPFAAHPGKIYPTDKMEAVVAELSRLHPSSRIFLFGGGEREREVLAQWEQRYANCLDASHLLGSLAQELVLMSHLDVMVSMDSSNMHLASLVGTRVVSVWGATHPCAGFMGWGQSTDDVVQVTMPCRPCSIYGNKPCQRGGYPCLTQISPADIVRKVELILNV